MPPLNEVPPLIRIVGGTLVCGGCRRRWRAPAEISQDNLQYLYEHVVSHQQPHRRSYPAHRRIQAWQSTKLEAVQCQTCLQWFTGHRCQVCFRDFAWRRSTAPPTTSEK